MTSSAKLTLLLIVCLSVGLSTLAAPVKQFTATGVEIVNLYHPQRGNGQVVQADLFYDYHSSVQKIVYYFGQGQTLSDLFDYEGVSHQQMLLFSLLALTFRCL